MELTTKRYTAKADLRALVNGAYPGDAKALIDEIAADLLAGLLKRTKSKAGKPRVENLDNDVAQEELAARLSSWLVRDRQRPSSDVCHTSLPLTKWNPEKVIERIGLSKSTLYRGDHVQFYCVIPVGKKNGRAYPAWQFVGDVPSHLPMILEIFNGNTRVQVNTFFMSEQDALNELSPAEVLAGLPFEDRSSVFPEQQRMLSLPVKSRLAKVSALARMEAAGA